MYGFWLALLLFWADEPRLPEPAPRDVLVVCPTALQPGLESWIDYREEQGYRFDVIEPPEFADELTLVIRSKARSKRLAALLLIGKPGSPTAACPTCFVPAEVNLHFGSTPEIASDNPLADFNNDGAPDVASARIPVDSREALESILARSIRYETESSHSGWRRRINLVAGVGGFDPMLDRVLETSSDWIIRQMIPEDYQLSMTWASWSSPYCPDPRQFSETAIGRFNEGCLFWVYIGHGWVDRLDRIKTPVGRFPILDRQSVPWLAAREGCPVALMLCCFTGAFDATSPSLAQLMLEQPGGPVAVIAGTRVTMPYGMSRFSIEMMDELFRGKCATLGELMYQTELRLLKEAGTGTTACGEAADSLASFFSPAAGKLDVERREHVEMMHLLGDPLLKLDRPKKIETAVESVVRAGGPLVVEGTAPFAGELVVELCYPRGRFWNKPQRRRPEDLDPVRSPELQADYERAGEMVCTALKQNVEAGPFRVELAVPDRARGQAIVRTFMASEAHHAVGSAGIEIGSTAR